MDGGCDLGDGVVGDWDEVGEEGVPVVGLGGEWAGEGDVEGWEDVPAVVALGHDHAEGWEDGHVVDHDRGGVVVEGDGGDALRLLVEDGVGVGEDAAKQEADRFAGVGPAAAGEQAGERGRVLGFDAEALDLGGVLLGEGLGAALEGAEQDAGAAEELAHAGVVGEEELVEAVGAVCLDEGLGGLDDLFGRALAGLGAGVSA